MRSYQQYIPQGIGELIDMLSMMMFSSPTFIDKTGRFPEQNLNTVFQALNEGLRSAEAKLGGERYRTLVEMSDRMRALFEVDPEDKTGDAIKGCQIIEDMQVLLKQVARKP